MNIISRTVLFYHGKAPLKAILLNNRLACIIMHNVSTIRYLQSSSLSLAQIAAYYHKINSITHTI